MEKKGFLGEGFKDLDSSGRDDHNVHARIGESVLASMEAEVYKTKNTIVAIREEIAEYQAEWDRECQGEDWSIGDVLATSFLRKMSQLNAEINLAYEICDSWRDKKYGII